MFAFGCGVLLVIYWLGQKPLCEPSGGHYEKVISKRALLDRNAVTAPNASTPPEEIS